MDAEVHACIGYKSRCANIPLQLLVAERKGDPAPSRQQPPVLKKANVSVRAQENASVRVYFDGCNLSVVHVKGHVQVHLMTKSVDLSTYV